MKYYINPINAELEDELNEHHNDEFVDDLIRNEGKLVELGEFRNSADHFGTKYYFRLDTTNGTVWHNGSHWYVHLGDPMFSNVFTKYKPVILPEELFEI